MLLGDIMAIDDYIKRARELRNVYMQYLGEVSPKPSTKTLIFTCMDARISLGYLFGLRPGEAVIIRNAGAYLTGDVIRSIVAAVYESNIENILVIGHTDCAMTKINVNELKRRIIEQNNLYPDEVDYYTGDFENWIKSFSDPYENVKRTMAILSRHPLIPKNVTIRGFVLDVEKAILDEVILKEEEMEGS